MNRLTTSLAFLAFSFCASAQVPQNQLIGAIDAPELLGGGGACVVQNDQAAIAAGFLGWVEGGTHAILIDPTGSGGPADPGCAGSFVDQEFQLNSVSFLLADATAFGQPGGIGTTTYTVSVHPLAVAGDPTMGPGAAIDSSTQTLTLDASGTYPVTVNLATVVEEPFFIAITFDDFDPNTAVTSTLWDAVPRPLGRQFVNNGGGFVDHGVFFNPPANGWVVVTVDGDFAPVGGDVVLPPPPAVPTMNSFGLLGMALVLMLGAGLFLRRRA